MLIPKYKPSPSCTLTSGFCDLRYSPVPVMVPPVPTPQIRKSTCPACVHAREIYAWVSLPLSWNRPFVMHWLTAMYSLLMVWAAAPPFNVNRS